MYNVQHKYSFSSDQTKQFYHTPEILANVFIFIFIFSFAIVLLYYALFRLLPIYSSWWFAMFVCFFFCVVVWIHLHSFCCKVICVRSLFTRAWSRIHFRTIRDLCTVHLILFHFIGNQRMCFILYIYFKHYLFNAISFFRFSMIIFTTHYIIICYTSNAICAHCSPCNSKFKFIDAAVTFLFSCRTTHVFDDVWIC